MLILLQPSEPLPGPDLARLARLTGLSAYDLKTRLRAGAWGVVKALADVEAAERLLASLRQEGFGAVAVPTKVAYDVERHAVAVRGIAFEPEQLVLRLTEREMPVPYAAVAALVRGEVQVGRRLRPRSASSATLRLAGTPAEDAAGSGDVFAAMDIHFFTVAWFARIDPRSLEFAEGGDGGPVERLEQLAQLLEGHTGVRVDRGAKASSLASFAERPPPGYALSTPPAAAGSRDSGDERFDAYSRLVAEAERAARRSSRR